MSTMIMSMNNEWSFHLGDVKIPKAKSHSDIYNSCKAGSCRGVPQSDFDVQDWEIVNLPHDYSVKQPFDPDGNPDWGCKPRDNAWYRKLFMLPAEMEGKRISLEFDGVATHCTVYFNGSVLGRSYGGYTPFSVDITDRAVFGAPNVLAVYVDAEQYEGWWYEGAGIYRNVRLVAKELVSIPQYGVYINPVPAEDDEDSWCTVVETKVQNSSYDRAKVQVVTEITDANGEVAAFSVAKPADVPDGRTVTITQRITIEEPRLWDIDDPILYTAVSRVFDADSNTLLDEMRSNFGFRTIAIDKNKGFILNGRPIKLFGTCNHQDHGGIGVAIPDRVWEYRVKRLKEMGSNAYRCSHGMAAPALIEACDRLGMLVMDENRRYETSEEVLAQLRTMVMRDRNHPSVVMYSIFNEEPLQSTPQGYRMAQHMIAEIKRLDDTRPVTGAMNGGVLNADGAAMAMDICGINYQLDSFEAFHEKYPDMPVIGSESTSSFSVRGCYKTEPEKNLIASYDEECADWGSTLSATWTKTLANDYIAGGFIWTGFDYLGEPTPHVWPSVSSFFGMMDVCGFEKYGYLMCQSIFKKEPVCRMLPHWNFENGESVRVIGFTNCEETELFINGRSQGRKPATIAVPVFWEVMFEAGEAEIRGYNKGQVCASEVVRTAGKAARIQLKPYSDTLYNDGCDAMTVDILVIDENGVIIPDAAYKIKLTAVGGSIIGTANGDPNCHEEFTSHERSVFHGMAQCVVAMDKNLSGEMILRAECEGLECCEISVKPEMNSRALPVVDSLKEQFVQNWKITHDIFDEKPDPTSLSADYDMNSWEGVSVENGSVPRFADSVGKYVMYRTKVHLPEGAKTPSLHFQQLWGECEVYINGELAASMMSEWAVEFDAPINTASNDVDVTVVCRSTNKCGGGITSVVLLRR